MADAIIETRLVAKHFGGLHAVDGVDLQVAEGAMHSIIGPNGAGKTTLFNLISGYLKPTSGQVFLRGVRSPVSRCTAWPTWGSGARSRSRTSSPISRCWRTCGCLPRRLAGITTRCGARPGGSAAIRSRRCERCMRWAWRRRPVRLPASCRTGTSASSSLPSSWPATRRCCCSTSPPPGMASEQVPALVEMIARIRSAGNKTIILVEHNMSIVMNISDRITVMHQGRVLAEGSPAEDRGERGRAEGVPGRLGYDEHS